MIGVQDLVMVVSAVVGIAGGVSLYINTRNDTARTALDIVKELKEQMAEMQETLDGVEEELKFQKLENERNKIQLNAMRTTIARLEELVKVYRKAFSTLYDQLIDHNIKPAVERPE